MAGAAVAWFPYRTNAARAAPRSAKGAATAPAPEVGTVCVPVWVGEPPPPPPPPWVEVMVVRGGGLVAV